MTTLTVEIPDKDSALFLELVKKFKGKVIDNSKKETLLAGIKQGLKEAKEIERGERKPLSLKDI